MIVAQEKTELTAQDVIDLATEWFRALDRHDTLEQVTPFLASRGLHMVFPEITVRNLDDFRTWYDNVLNLFFDETHELTRTQVRRISATESEISLTVNWQTKTWTPPAAHSVWKGFDADQTWTVVLEDGRPRIREYSVDKITPVPGSPGL
ncbi:nuclear transport factor 2 family protein [Streptomyces misionensis]|uniref:nuclear transport factor 2 family protein n=1 Tax=Streptomyces misionensis TaxID=67331 RepID=UPI0036BDE8E7